MRASRRPTPTWSAWSSPRARARSIAELLAAPPGAFALAVGLTASPALPTTLELFGPNNKLFTDVLANFTLWVYGSNAGGVPYPGTGWHPH